MTTNNDALRDAAENYLRGQYGAYRGHPAWRALQDAFIAGAAYAQQPAPIDGIHSCSLHCERPECIKAQRDELRDSQCHHRPPCEECGKYTDAALSTAAEPVWCRLCDNTGDIHSPTGEWRGVCPICSHAPAVPDAAKPEPKSMFTVDLAEHSIWNVRYYGSSDLKGYNIYAFQRGGLTHGERIANLGEDGDTAEALCLAHNELAMALADEKETARQLNAALREATEQPTFMGEPALAARPETQGERAELIANLRNIAAQQARCHYPIFGSVEVMRKAAALLSSDARTAGQAEPDMRAICEALGFDPTNHHNAAKCPYCRPTDTAQPAPQEEPVECKECAIQPCELCPDVKPRNLAQQAAPGAVVDGWKMVPVEPTAEMIQAAGSSWVDNVKIYSAMLSAAPKPQGE